MSWITELAGFKSSSTSRSGRETNSLFTNEARAAREEKRSALEANRLLRKQQKANKQNFYRVGVSAPPSPISLSKSATPTSIDEVDEDCISLPDIYFIESDIFEERVKMVNFDMKNEDNAADAMKHLGQIKVSWDAEDPGFFFQKLETELMIFGLNKQFTKRQALIRNLPEDVSKGFKHLVILQEDAAGEIPYKTLKTALMKAYGPKPGAAYQRAKNRVMVSTPSLLLKLQISDLCPTNLVGCHCASIVWGMFQDQIPLYLKSHLANEEFSATTMQSIMDKADNFWNANQTDTTVAAVATATPSDPTPSTEVAAIARGRGFRARGGRGFAARGRGRGGNGKPENFNPQNDPRGKRHESNPPWNSCTAHWLYSDKAWKCQAPLTCPLKNKVTPKN